MLSHMAVVMQTVLLLACSHAPAVREETAPPEGQSGLTLQPFWSIEGHWTGIDVDTLNQEVYSLQDLGFSTVHKKWDALLVRIGSQGQILGGVRLEADRAMPKSFALIRWAPSVECGIVTSARWTSDVIHAFLPNGQLAWRFSAPDAPNDVKVIEIENGLTAVVIGCNGAGGLCAVGLDGNLLWRNGKLRNVWSVDSIKANGVGGRLVATSTEQGLHVMDARGEVAQHIRIGFDPRLVATVGGDTPGMCVVGTRGPSVARIRLPHHGAFDWKVVVEPARASYLDQVTVSQDARLIAAASSVDGKVFVFNAVDGHLIATVEGGPHCRAAWLSSDRQTILITASVRRLSAFKVREPSRGPL
jgi:outer membrane protein assembly factor BamB